MSSLLIGFGAFKVVPLGFILEKLACQDIIFITVEDTPTLIKSNFEILAKYNTLLNKNICNRIANVSNETLWTDKGAFFGSILGTLNHLMVGDLIWLNRLNGHPNHSEVFKALRPLMDFTSPTKLTQILYDNKEDFIENRKMLDEMIIQFVEETNEIDYSEAIRYINTKGDAFSKSFSMLLLHLFNHQTHHRGQVTTLLTQIGVDIGETDLLMLIPDF